MSVPNPMCSFLKSGLLALVVTVLCAPPMRAADEKVAPPVNVIGTKLTIEDKVLAEKYDYWRIVVSPGLDIKTIQGRLAGLTKKLEELEAQKRALQELLEMLKGTTPGSEQQAVLRKSVERMIVEIDGLEKQLDSLQKFYNHLDKVAAESSTLYLEDHLRKGKKGKEYQVPRLAVRLFDPEALPIIREATVVNGLTYLEMKNKVGTLRFNVMEDMASDQALVGGASASILLNAANWTSNSLATILTTGIPLGFKVLNRLILADSDSDGASLSCYDTVSLASLNQKGRDIDFSTVAASSATRPGHQKRFYAGIYHGAVYDPWFRRASNLCTPNFMSQTYQGYYLPTDEAFVFNVLLPKNQTPKVKVVYLHPDTLEVASENFTLSEQLTATGKP